MNFTETELWVFLAGALVGCIGSVVIIYAGPKIRGVLMANRAKGAPVPKKPMKKKKVAPKKSK